MGMLEVLVMLLETEAAHHNSKDGRLRQSLMMESLNHCVSTPNAPQVYNPLNAGNPSPGKDELGSRPCKKMPSQRNLYEAVSGGSGDRDLLFVKWMDTRFSLCSGGRRRVMGHTN
ncbi:unnamed protein product [Arctogadus glacialis]